MDIIDIGLYFMYALMVIAVVGALVVFPVMSAIESPKSFIKSLYFILALVVLFGIAYAVSDSSVTPEQEVGGITPTIARMVSAGLITFYTVLVVAVIGLIYSEINKALN